MYKLIIIPTLLFTSFQVTSQDIWDLKKSSKYYIKAAKMQNQYMLIKGLPPNLNDKSARSLYVSSIDEPVGYLGNEIISCYSESLAEDSELTSLKSTIS